MLQTNLIAPGHADLVTYATYDFYGERLATCSADLKIKLFRKSIDTWEPEAEWKAHDAPVLHLSFAHPIHGSLLASSSHDRTVRIWEEPSSSSSSSTSTSITTSVPITPGQPQAQTPLGGAQPGGNSVVGAGSGVRWIERAVLSGAKGSVRSVEFSPPNPSFGLRLASISTDSHLRIHASLDPDLSDWSLAHDIHVPSLPSPQSTDDPSSNPSASGAASGGAGNAAGAASGGAGTGGVAVGGSTDSGTASSAEMASGGWGISWGRGERGGLIISLDPTPTTILHLTPNSSSPITSIAWAPACGRSYHLLAVGARDGSVRIWRIEPPNLDMIGNGPLNGVGPVPLRESWKGDVDAEFPKGPRIGMVAWNATGTTLTTSDDEGVIKIYKATYAKAWKLLGKMSAEEPPADEST